MKLAWIPLFVSFAMLAQSAGAQCQPEKHVPADAGQGDNFGWSVAVSGDWAMAGAYGDDDLGSQSGAVYVFQSQGGAWVQMQKLHANDGGENQGFGWRVALEGDRAVFTATGAPQVATQLAGAAYVFDRIGSSWVQVARLTASDATYSTQIGQSVAISGARIVVGAEQEDHIGIASGAAYLFEQVGGNWIQAQKLIASDGDVGHFFGHDVALDGERCVVGALGVSTGTVSNHGAAYVFERQGTQWVQTAKLLPSNPASFDYFGVAVACSGTSVFVGAQGEDIGGSNSGAVYVFELESGGWVERQQLVAPDAAPSDILGESLAISGSVLVASATGDDDLASSSGAVYVFERSNGFWSPTGKVFPPLPAGGDGFGYAISVSGRTLIVGTPLEDVVCPTNPVCNSGSISFKELPSGATQYGSCASSSPCQNADDFGGCRNSTGQGAVLSACGTSSVAFDDLVLHADFLPPSVFGIVFVGAAEALAPLGDGLRVAAPAGPIGLYRFPAAQVSAQGSYTLGPGIAAYSQFFPGQGVIAPGQSRRFQLWYRDGQGPCGSGTNTSNGVRVEFAP